MFVPRFSCRSVAEVYGNWYVPRAQPTAPKRATRQMPFEQVGGRSHHTKPHRSPAHLLLRDKTRVKADQSSYRQTAPSAQHSACANAFGHVTPSSQHVPPSLPSLHSKHAGNEATGSHPRAGCPAEPSFLPFSPSFASLRSANGHACMCRMIRWPPAADARARAVQQVQRRFRSAVQQRLFGPCRAALAPGGGRWSRGHASALVAGVWRGEAEGRGGGCETCNRYLGVDVGGLGVVVW